MLFHGFMMYEILSLNISEDQAVLSEALKQAISDNTILIVMIGMFSLLMTCLAWALLLKPGVHAKISL